MTILISGGCGFIGPNLIARLAAFDEPIVAVDNLSRGRAEHLPAGVELFRLDLSRDDCIEPLWQP